MNRVAQTGTSDVSSSSVGVCTNMTSESSSGHTQSKFPHLPPSKVVVFNHWTLVSDDLVSAVRNSGQYKATFKCNIVDGGGKACGTDRTLLHYRGKSVSTTNLINEKISNSLLVQVYMSK